MNHLQNDFIEKQCWYHYQDHYYPQPAKEIRKIIDIYTNFANIPIPMGNLNFLGLKIYARNSNKNEVAFIWQKSGKNVILNLDLDAFPSAPFPYSIYKHVKLEIEYILVPSLESKNEESCIQKTGSYTHGIETSVQESEESEERIESCEKEGPNIFEGIRIKEKRKTEGAKKIDNAKIFFYNFFITMRNVYFLIIDRYIWPRKTAKITIKEISHPEFDIIIPKGWEIENQGNEFYYIAKWKDKNGQTVTDVTKEERPTIQWQDGKLRYNYLLKLKNGYYNAQLKGKTLDFQYFTKLSWMYVLLSFLIPLLFFTFSILILLTADFKLFFPMKFDESLLLTYSVLVVSYLFAYIGYIKEGYALPFQNRTELFISVTIAVIAISIVCVQYPIDDEIKILIEYLQKLLHTSSNDILW